MGKVTFKPGTMLYPVPAIMATCGDIQAESNIITVAWTGTICSDPPMAYISVRKSRYSHELLMKYKEFALNLTTADLALATDFCGVKSGRDLDKFKETGLRKIKANVIKAPLIAQSPMSIECKVTKVIELGSHDMFLGEVVSVSADEEYMEEDGRFNLEKSELLTFSHDGYHKIGKYIGRMGYSVMKKKTKKRLAKKKY